jgi:hypothetical protein
LAGIPRRVGHNLRVCPVLNRRACGL